MNCSLQVLVAQCQAVIKAFVTDATHPAFRERLGLENGGESVRKAANHRELPEVILTY